MASQMYGAASDLFEGCDFLGNVPCLAGELEAQVQRLESHSRDTLPKGYSATDVSGRSSLSIMGEDFTGPDYLENVTLEDLAAVDNYGPSSCFAQQQQQQQQRYTADSMPHIALGAGRCSSAAGWGGSSHNASYEHPARAARPDTEMDVNQVESESEHTNMGHEGESSGVGHKGQHNGSGSEQTEDNMTTGPRVRDEEHMSMPTLGMSMLAPAAPAALPRTSSIECSPLMNLNGAGAQRRAQMVRSHSYIAPQAMPAEAAFHQPTSNSLMQSRTRSFSFDAGHFGQRWQEQCELLAPRLPPSVSELEVLEDPEEGTLMMPMMSSQPMMGTSSMHRPRSVPAGMVNMASSGGGGMVPMGVGMSRGMGMGPGGGGMGGMSSGGMMNNPYSGMGVGPGGMDPAGGSPTGLKRKAPPAFQAPQPVAMHKKHQIVQPQQQQPHQQQQQHRSMQAAPAGVKVGSPTRAQRVGPPMAHWPEGPTRQSSGPAAAAARLGSWQVGPPGSDIPYTGPSGNGGPAGGGNGGGMKAVRSMPANMDSFLQGYELPSRPQLAHGAYMGEPSPNHSSASASTPHNGFFSQFYDASPRPSVLATMAEMKGKAAAQAAGAAAEGKRSGAAAQPAAQGGAAIPKPKKRASPNGAPPKAPAPNPNGHSCTQCGTQTTPVWRAGPAGPKTLCNACGVRYMKHASNQKKTPRSG